MNELALFAGAGGGLLASALLGWRTVCAVEYDPHAAGILVSRQNDGSLEPCPVWDDIRTFDGRPWAGVVDVVSGGFPCQAFSSAARGRNCAENLWPEMLRIVGEVGPEFIFAENVAENAIVRAQADLAACGYTTRRCKLSAADMGADHIRERYWLLAHANNQGKLRRPVDAKAPWLPELRHRVWQTEPREPRVADGMASRVDRFRATGNGQVPAVAAVAYMEMVKTL